MTEFGDKLKLASLHYSELLYLNMRATVSSLLLV